MEKQVTLCLKYSHSGGVDRLRSIENRFESALLKASTVNEYVVLGLRPRNTKCFSLVDISATSQ